MSLWENTDECKIESNFEDEIGKFRINILENISNQQSIAIVTVDEDGTLLRGYISKGGDDNFKLIAGLHLILNSLSQKI